MIAIFRRAVTFLPGTAYAPKPAEACSVKFALRRGNVTGSNRPAAEEPDGTNLCFDRRFGAQEAFRRTGAPGNSLPAICRELPFFQTPLSNMDMVLAKSDIAIASRYSELVADHALRENRETRGTGGGKRARSRRGWQQDASAPQRGTTA
jgi:Phosphoenolpyruvate carboxylase